MRRILGLSELLPAALRVHRLDRIEDACSALHEAGHRSTIVASAEYGMTRAE